jgi:hypothetical protein
MSVHSNGFLFFDLCIQFSSLENCRYIYSIYFFSAWLHCCRILWERKQSTLLMLQSCLGNNDIQKTCLGIKQIGSTGCYTLNYVMSMISIFLLFDRNRSLNFLIFFLLLESFGHGFTFSYNLVISSVWPDLFRGWLSRRDVLTKDSE